MVEDKDGNELEWDQGRNAWVPAVSWTSSLSERGERLTRRGRLCRSRMRC